MTDTVKVQLPKAYLRLDPNMDQTHPDLDGLIRLMCAANRQPQRGRFKSLDLVERIVGKARAKRFLERRDLTPEGGRLYLDGWDDWQEGDLTVGDRQRRIRAKRAAAVTPPLPDRDDDVTEPPSQPLPDPPADRDRPSEALDVKAEDVETFISKAPTATALPKPRAGSPKNEARLTKHQLDSWANFGPRWNAFKEAWLGRGLLYAPFGAPDDDDTSQRGLLFQVLDARPTEIVRWVKEAPTPTSREVITYILEKWHEVREDAGVEDEEWREAKLEERRKAIGSVTHISDLISRREPA